MALITALLFSASINAQELNLTQSTSSAITTSPALLQVQRSQYLDAKAALKKKDFAGYKNYLPSLKGYPLLPYLEYEELARRLYLLPHQDVEQFLEANQGTYIADRMYRSWLTILASKKRWHDFQGYFNPEGANTTELKCQYLWARIQTNDREALKDVEELWNVGRSQPDKCDPIFDAWLEAGGLTPDIAWQRHSKAIGNRQLTLATYLVKLMPTDLQKLGKLYREVDRNPQALKNHRRFHEQSPYMHEIILHGLKRYARKDPLEALAQWQRYDAQHYFPSEERTETLEYLITQLAINGHLKETETMLAQSKSVKSDDVIAWLVRDSLSNEDWPKVYEYINMLPAEEQQTERWLYWRARTIEKLKIEDPNYPSPQQIYASLSLTRSFYGFLSADIVGQEYTFLDRPVNPSQKRVEELAVMPALMRTMELFNLSLWRDGRREWIYATRDMDPESLLAVGKLAEEWGWYRQGIEAVVDARHWDDLQIRFPLAFHDEVQVAAKNTNIEPPLLFAIARQESAFAPDARSSAGALGLMQLMPATARQTAHSIGVKYNYWSLIEPEHNIQLGSTYLNQLLRQFDGNRVLAAAAYNAGPNRVKQWLKKNDKRVPYDIWIETIPFKETRGYVQNVLAYSVIYGYRLGNQTPMLTESENQHPSFGNL